MGHKDLRLGQTVYISVFYKFHFLAFFHWTVSNLIFGYVTVKTIYSFSLLSLLRELKCLCQQFFASFAFSGMQVKLSFFYAGAGIFPLNDRSDTRHLNISKSQHFEISTFCSSAQLPKKLINVKLKEYSAKSASPRFTRDPDRPLKSTNLKLKLMYFNTSNEFP